MILAAILLSAAAQATPADDPEAFDLRCMVAMGLLRDNPDPDIRASATAAALFFFGRVDARIPEAELEDRAMQEALAIEHVDQQALLRDCGAFMSARGEVLSDVGRRMIARGQAQETH